jgi:hypothetical protein
MLRLALLAALAAVGMGNAYAGYTNDDVNPWADDAKEWECAMPLERPASNDRNPVYKTEIYFTRGYNERTDKSWLATFNVRHTLRNGDRYDRADQYSGISVKEWSLGKRTGVQQWTGYSTRYAGLRIVGELKWTQYGREQESGFTPIRATYTEFFYNNGKLQTTMTATCHWTGPTC